MSEPGTSKTKDRTMENFWSEAGALYQFPDDNGTLHVGLSKEPNFPRFICGFKNDAPTDNVAAHSVEPLQLSFRRSSSEESFRPVPRTDARVGHQILWWNTNHHTGDFNAGANNLVGKVIR
ncbi:Hypothetical protein FKW44_012360, partial [Caligus rogercresseyi]